MEAGVKERARQTRQEHILGVLLNKYRADPEKFRSCLPEVAQELQELLQGRRKGGHRGVRVLTDLERERLQKSLAQLLKREKLSGEGAIQALEYCATLVQDGSLPPEVNRQTVLRLLHQVIGKPLSRMKKATTIPLRDGEAVSEVPVLRGVHLHVSWKHQLLSISISPSKFKERSKALGFVGVAKDTATDVAQRHDVYLAEAISNGGP